MKRSIFLLTLLLAVFIAGAQETVYPVPAHKGVFYIKNATVHVGNGQVLNNVTIKVTDSKIDAVGVVEIPANAEVIDATGKQVYPGLIASNTDLGLKEIAASVRGSNDYAEIGDYNLSVRSLIAYNTDSKIINTLRSNGILLACIVPQGGLISGSSSVVQLDAWTWEDAAYKADNGIHFNMPTFMARPKRPGGRNKGEAPETDPIKEGLEKIESVKKIFREAKAYAAGSGHAHTNLKFEAIQGLFTRKQKLFVHCNLVKEMLVAIDFVKEFGFDVVIVGGSESYQIAPILKQNNIGVILNQVHQLPVMQDDDIDQPFKTPAVLQKAGVLYAINDDHEESRFRNLPFNAGTAVAYGLSKEDALTAISLNAAKLLGIDDKAGSVEQGKDANIVICDGDILDMRTSIVSRVFIQGRDIPLVDKQKLLYERYKKKYGLK